MFGFLSVLSYKDQFFYHDWLDLHGFQVKLDGFSYSKIADPRLRMVPHSSLIIHSFMTSLLLLIRWLNIVLRAVSGNSRDGSLFQIRKNMAAKRQTISQNLLIKLKNKRV